VLKNIDFVNYQNHIQGGVFMKQLLTALTALAIILISLQISFAAGGDIEIRNAAGASVGKIKSDGSVRNKQASKIGTIKISGTVQDKTGRKIGSFDSGGKLRDSAGRFIGKVNEKGEIRNSKGSLVARIKSNGEIRDKTGKKIASAKPYLQDARLRLTAYLCFFYRPDLFQ